MNTYSCSGPVPLKPVPMYWYHLSEDDLLGEKVNSVAGRGEVVMSMTERVQSSECWH